MENQSDSSSSQSSETYTAKSTLNFLGRCLREQRFILRGQMIKIKDLKAAEKETRNKIENLHQRIRREFIMNPNLFKKINTKE